MQSVLLPLPGPVLAVGPEELSNAGGGVNCTFGFDGTMIGGWLTLGT